MTVNSSCAAPAAHRWRLCHKHSACLLLCCCPFADELQRNIDRLASELHATRQELQQLSEELLALHEHADMETAQVGRTLLQLGPDVYSLTVLIGQWCVPAALAACSVQGCCVSF